MIESKNAFGRHRASFSFTTVCFSQYPSDQHAAFLSGLAVSVFENLWSPRGIRKAV